MASKPKGKAKDKDKWDHEASAFWAVFTSAKVAGSGAKKLLKRLFSLTEVGVYRVGAF